MTVSPRASVIVAAYHSARVIGECLEAIRRQSIQDFETIVVNSAPGDGTREIVAGRFPEVRFVEHDTRLLPHAARNRGVEVAAGRLLMFTDADCRPEPDWLAQSLGAIDAGHAVVCGSIEPAERGWFADGVHLCKYSFRLSTLPAGPCRIAGTANASYARSVWAVIGPFDGSCYSGDALLAWSAARHGIRPWFEPRAVVRHVFDHTLGEFWRERRERGVDFVRARARAEGWSTLRLAICVAGFPVLPVIPLARGCRDAVRAGWTMPCLWTMPVQIVGHVGWSLGEAQGALAMLLAR